MEKGSNALPAGYRWRLVQQQVRGGVAALALLAAVALAARSTIFALPATLLLPAALIAEALFAVWFARKRAAFEAWRPEVPHHDCAANFERFIESGADLRGFVPLEDVLRRWFGGVPIGDIRAGNLAELMSYGFFYKRRSQMLAEGRWVEAEAMGRRVEAAWGICLQPGFNEAIAFMAHLQDTLQCHYRPGIFYLLGELLAAVKHVMLVAQGFRCYAYNGYVYYTYDMPAVRPGSPAPPPASGGNGRTPILLLHGVGLGLLPYVPFMARLAAAGHPVVAIEFRYLSMRLCRSIPSADEVAPNIAAIMDLHDLAAPCIIGHSFGTLLASRLLQLRPGAASSLALLDPVCFLIFTGHLLKNFVYHAPKALAELTTWFVSRDLHTAVAVQRPFHWSLLNLWPEQLPGQSLVVLSDGDILVPVPEVKRMLAGRPGMALMSHPSHAHADFIADSAWQDEVIVNVLAMIARVDAARAKLPAGLGAAAPRGRAARARAVPVHVIDATAPAPRHRRASSSGGGDSTGMEMEATAAAGSLRSGKHA